MYRSLRKRHFAECCENDKDGSKTAPIPVKFAGACSELMRAPARPSGKTGAPRPGQQLAARPTTGAEEAPFSNLNVSSKIADFLLIFYKFYQNVAEFC